MTILGIKSIRHNAFASGKFQGTSSDVLIVDAAACCEVSMCCAIVL